MTKKGGEMEWMETYSQYVKRLGRPCQRDKKEITAATAEDAAGRRNNAHAERVQELRKKFQGSY